MLHEGQTWERLPLNHMDQVVVDPCGSIPWGGVVFVYTEHSNVRYMFPMDNNIAQFYADRRNSGHWESSTYGGSGGAMSPIPERPKWVMFDATDDDVDYTILDPDFFGAYDSVDYSFSRIDDNAANTVTLIGEISGVTDMTLEPRQSITIRKFSGQWHLISSAIAT